MPDQEMIDRVAKAILDTPNASDYRTLVANNAIKAMREPTEKMIMSPDGNTGCAKEVWQSMIDAILND